MLEWILGLFVSDEKVASILANPVIEFIFMLLLITFVVAVLVHVVLFRRLNKLRNYLVNTNRMDVEPLQSLKEEYDKRQEKNTVKVETFVEERFSGWRVMGIPVINLIKMLQMTVSVFILIGVLGTFIGLTISLGSISGTGEQLVENVASVLSGIDIAFYTSIAGMGFSLMMTVLLRALNTEQMLTDIMLKVESTLETNEQNTMGRLTDVSETINESIVNLQQTNQQSLQGIEQAFAGFQAYTTGLQQSAEDLAAFNDGLSENLTQFQQLFENMREITNGFGESTSRLNENFDTLFAYFQQTDEKNERMVKAFENTYEKVKDVSTAQTDILKRFEATMNDFKQFTKSLLQGQESVEQSMEAITQQSSELVKKMEAHNKDFKQVFGSDLHGKLAGISNYLGDLSRDFDRLGESVTELPHALEVINQTQVEHRHLLSDRFEELKDFNKTFHSHLKNHAVDQVAFEKHLRDATNLFDRVGRKNSELIQEIHSTITQMGQTLSQRENQMDESLERVRDTFSSYVANLESTMCDKMEKVVRNITGSMEATNDGIKREFMEMRRLSEEINQNNSRYIQKTLQDLSREIQTLNLQLNTVNQQSLPRQNGVGMRQNEY